ncbi:Aldo/keto reductase [Hortaea werneckii]|uniref:NADP-dependent oxidoreductase domain-containing protein n=1 Tax=Hortaea werneckii TaxID=91943 RepID=A0A3M7H8Q5_HORWE|nr:Aldo/keto reductase [Hortaea werneckii]KAI6870395.1 Aldo/keto reductase [Hortaea werneckii]KAI7290865.1 Aldo/keto reductase [Hortaea werneckii]KAI7353428.1 Aldo/keto reductase [Hortaea werneckii]KAI7572403.1 Aldo/keto reductase [Hortaea werneckii]
MSPPTRFKLNTGAQIPAVGLGTWKSAPGEVTKAVAYALKDGYRHIDAALIYGNENEVGQGIKDSGVAREEIFITSKLWNTHHPNASEGLQKTLDALGTDYVDLYLIHWPVRLVPNETSELLPTNPDGSRSVDRSWDQNETWRQMEAVYKSGKAKAIGVANWSIPYLEELSKKWTVTPAVNQVELHPYLPQHELRQWCEKRGILLEAYSPLGSTGAPLMNDPEIQQIAEKHGATAATVLISYHVCKGTVALPKSVSEKRITSNRLVVALSGEDLAKLDALAAKGKAKRINTPAWGFDLGFDDWYGPKK